MSVLNKSYFHDEAAAFEKLESIIWPNGPVCPHCGAVDRITPVNGKTARIGLKRCGHCRQQFTVKVGTVFESSHVPLHKWLQAAFLMASSKKGISSHQLHRTLEVTYKTAWFMAHRLREAMSEGYVSKLGPIGGEGATVEVDEAYLGPNPFKDTRVRARNAGGVQPYHMPIVSLVERGGRVRSFHIDNVNRHNVMGLMGDQIKADTQIFTDKSSIYNRAKTVFLDHHSVNHSKGEYRRGGVHTNTVEGFFAIFKRGMKGIYQHCGEQHLKRYLAEFDFRYNARLVSDADRTEVMLSGIVGKRLTYRGV
jgi:transposase-like protein